MIFMREFVSLTIVPMATKKLLYYLQKGKLKNISREHKFDK